MNNKYFMSWSQHLYSRLDFRQNGSGLMVLRLIWQHQISKCISGPYPYQSLHHCLNFSMTGQLSVCLHVCLYDVLFSSWFPSICSQSTEHSTLLISAYPLYHMQCKLPEFHILHAFNKTSQQRMVEILDRKWKQCFNSISGLNFFLSVFTF